MNVPKPVVLVILDGWGLAPPGPGNAVFRAATPNMDKLWQDYPHARLKAKGEAVGLPKGEMGTSEAGHLIIGAGRIFHQDFSRISFSIKNGSFFKNQALMKACQHALAQKSNLHLLGILSLGSVHAEKNHLYALLKLIKKEKLSPSQAKLHLFTDGRDSPPKSALKLIQELEKVIKETGVGEIASICGRYFAMDRDRRWSRTQKAYAMLTLGQGEKAASARTAVCNNYQKGTTDEFIPPTNLADSLVKENDAVIFFNFRTDRARQLTKAFVDPQFSGFKRKKFLKKIFFVSMTEFEKGLDVSAVAFKPHKVNLALPQVIAIQGLKQLHIAETEKYAFVTYYFNGLYEDKVAGEDRLLIPSPKVATYDLKPAMSSFEITATVIKKIKLNYYDFILINYANPDMVGHTGILKAGIKACEATDRCVGKIVPAVLSCHGTCLITSDHGNVEEMIDPKTGKVSTKHSLNKVPFILVGKPWYRRKIKLHPGGLANIAPTVLRIMKIPKPACMTDRSLI